MSVSHDFPTLKNYQPESWLMLKDSICAAEYSLLIGIGYSEELLAKKDAELGREHRSIRETAEKMEKEIAGMRMALIGLREPNGITNSPPYFPGIGCQCGAHSESECGCSGVDWTPSELRELRAKYAMHHAEVERLSGENIRLKRTLAKLRDGCPGKTSSDP